MADAVSEQIAAVVRRMDSIPRVAEYAASLEMIRLSAQLADQGETFIRAATPRDHRPRPERGALDAKYLADSTAAIVAGTGDDGKVISYFQTKVVDLGEKNGGIFPLWRLVTGGHASYPPIEPRVKKALYWPGLPHPVGASWPGQVPAKPYLDEAWGFLIPRLREGLAYSVRSLIAATMKEIKA